MKKILNCCILIVSLALAGCIVYGFVLFGIPFLTAKSEYTKNIPTIEKIQSELAISNATSDSLLNKTKEYEMKIDMLQQIVSEQSNSKQLQKQISSQLKSVEDKLQNNK